MPKNQNKKTIGINMPIEMSEELEERAASMGIGVSKFCLIIIDVWLNSRKKLVIKG